MFESNMVENIKAINNPWRDLVTPQFKVFLDTLSTSKQTETTEKEEDSEL